MISHLSKEEERETIDSLRRYISEEWEHDVSEFQGRLFLDYILKEIGPFAYNRGVQDAKAYFSSKAEDLGGVCFEEPLTHWMKSQTSQQVRRKPD